MPSFPTKMMALYWIGYKKGEQEFRISKEESIPVVSEIPSNDEAPIESATSEEDQTSFNENANQEP